MTLTALVGCATLSRDSFDQRFGAVDPSRYDQPAAPAPGSVSWRVDVQPILQRRCVVCHGCYDAPCQIKLGAWQGVARGGSSDDVYDTERLREAEPSRLFVDAQLPSQWRAKGFFPVLNERSPTPEAQLAGSLLYQTLVLKQQQPLPAGPVLGDGFDFSLDRAMACPRIEQFEAHARKAPLAGMPYGLPGLDARELDTLARWLQAGAPYEGDVPLTATQRQQLQSWEAFLNGASAKERLMSRYLFEHLFLGHLYFEADATHRAFRLVRSSTPPGQPLKLIASRRPYDDPGVERVWYRLEPEREVILAKTHLPYALSPARMDKYRGWFLGSQVRVSALPSYAVEVASNPFVAFRELPIDARYRFLLDEAQFFIMNFIKGPVCRGQMAVDVIEDQFWVAFVEPTALSEAIEGDTLLRQAERLTLPAAQGSDSGLLAPWLKMARQERSFLQTKSQALQQAFSSGRAKLDLSLIWDGEGRNRNAALTIFRHFDSASVVQGFVGAPPKTAWVIDYPLFERIFYLLVSGYDVYGNVGHQLNSRLYMDFMRMEGEFNFLVLLPQRLRESAAMYWYRGATNEAREYVYGKNAYLDAESAVPYRSGDPQRELYELLRRRLAPVLDARFDLTGVPDTKLRAELQSLAAVKGASLSWLPEMSVLRVDGAGGGPRYFTLLRNTAHSNVAHLAREKSELLPAENTLTVVPGFIGAYPNAMYRTSAAELPALRAAIAAMVSEADYRKLADRFALRRTNPQFWAASDALHDAYAVWAPLEAGLFDYNRLQNR
ncbi:MAG: fatty acid cis/trans isomerase [Rubrivivax sp.]